jgi:phage shock protein PspC (stress-responsive transcriptional regulator)
VKQFYHILFFLQRHGFHVCQRIADRFGMRARVVRTSFIYVTFVTVGFGFAFYLILAFWMRIKDLLFVKRTSVFDI